MKKFTKVISVLLVFASLALLLTACSTKLSGKYTAGKLISQSYTFDNRGNVTVSAAGLDLATGTYKIEHGKITFEFNTDGLLSIGGNSLALNHSMSFEKKGNSIFLDGVEYVKE